MDLEVETQLTMAEELPDQQSSFTKSFAGDSLGAVSRMAKSIDDLSLKDTASMTIEEEPHDSGSTNQIGASLTRDSLDSLGTRSPSTESGDSRKQLKRAQKKKWKERKWKRKAAEEEKMQKKKSEKKKKQNT